METYDFNEYLLKEYNEYWKKHYQAQINKIQKTITETEETIQKILNATDEHTILKEGKKINELTSRITDSYYKLLDMQETLQEITEKENHEARLGIDNNKYEELWDKIKTFPKQEYDEKIEKHQFTPQKGTWAYCNCKLYNKMGKIIKQTLKEEYPEIMFSVTTSGDNLWNDRASIKVKKINEEHLEKDNCLKDEFIKELRKKLLEYEPRMTIGIHKYMW